MRVRQNAVIRTHRRSCINKRSTRLNNLAGIELSLSVSSLLVWLFLAHLERDESTGSAWLKCFFRWCSRRPYHVPGLSCSARGIRTFVTKSLHLHTAINRISSETRERGWYSLSFGSNAFIQVNSISHRIDNLPIRGRCKGGFGTQRDVFSVGWPLAHPCQSFINHLLLHLHRQISLVNGLSLYNRPILILKDIGFDI